MLLKFMRKNPVAGGQASEPRMLPPACVGDALKSPGSEALFGAAGSCPGTPDAPSQICEALAAVSSPPSGWMEVAVNDRGCRFRRPPFVVWVETPQV
ncbi:MAG TPA: hypothetical protein VLA61_04225 [Ideonella sp.]|uniref:hypothetical protein n=1 Tax=Ideonella sp. TaxID=1929293 RepID=UPI002CA25A1D|nr:hypothetical protein [Ideonella sp.]HSI47446.1 hypothetical protein [Ideonella sp.]